MCMCTMWQVCTKCVIVCMYVRVRVCMCVCAFDWEKELVAKLREFQKQLATN